MWSFVFLFSILFSHIHLSLYQKCHILLPPLECLYIPVYPSLPLLRKLSFVLQAHLELLLKKSVFTASITNTDIFVVYCFSPLWEYKLSTELLFTFLLPTIFLWLTNSRCSVNIFWKTVLCNLHKSDVLLVLLGLFMESGKFGHFLRVAWVQWHCGLRLTDNNVLPL